jgi:glycosyltransferase involved in cell wall biosynthesis
MIDVLMLTHYDNANTGYRFSKCLELLGLKVLFYKGRTHSYNYPKQGKVHRAIAKTKKIRDSASTFYIPALQPIVKEAKVIHFIASSFINTGLHLTNKKVVVQHGGSLYRQYYKRLNRIFNPIADATIIQMPDLLNLGAKNETYISFPVDTDYLKPNFKRKSNKILIGHFPSGIEVKGTRLILDAIQRLKNFPELKNRFEYVGIKDLNVKPKSGGISWDSNLKRVSNCDVIIDACNLKQRGKVYGEWGNSAFEAAALGTIPITHSLKVGLYEKIYGKCPLHIANRKKDVVNRLREIILMSDKELLAEKKKLRKWIVRKHSFKATAKRLWDEIYCNFF